MYPKPDSKLVKQPYISIKAVYINAIVSRTTGFSITGQLFGKRFPSEGGAAYYLGDDGTPWKERPRETWITCRMAHVYSIAAMTGFEEGRALAEAAIRGLAGELTDQKSGGWYAGLTADHYAAFLAYLEDKVHDPVYGSWFHQLDRNNKPTGTVWPGKSDLYHAFQATRIPYLGVERSIAYAVRHPGP